MFRIVASIVTLCACAAALSAQTAPAFPGTESPFDRFMRQYNQLGRPSQALVRLTSPELIAPEKPVVCSIPLLRMRPSRFVDRMPVLRVPRNIDRMPMATLPAPPCPEEKR